MCLANIAREIKRLLEPRPTISQYRGEQLIVGPVARRISSLPSPLSSPDECGTRAKRLEANNAFCSLPNVAVIMACRDYYAIARRWNIKWTAIGRLNIKVVTKRSPTSNCTHFSSPDFVFPREKEERIRRDILREKSLGINWEEAHLTK